jgi:predicted metal-dependent hydrolase
VQLDLFQSARLRQPRSDWLLVAQRRLPLELVRNRLARRYILRLGRNGVPRVTIPRGGSEIEAKRFAQKHVTWLEKQLLRQAQRSKPAEPWRIGTEIQFRGEPVRFGIEANDPRSVRFATATVRVPEGTADLRPLIERHLWRLAATELPRRVLQLATAHQLRVQRITVRNQRSRWGSCSRRGTISLNWRLIQTPPFVCDYIILHELAHLKQMNHSARFWREVGRLCPGFEAAERWLKQHSRTLAM